MDLVTLGRTLGFSFAAGVNLYATVAILGLAARYGWVELPEQFQTFNHPVVIGAAIAMYLVEFFADKIPYVDSLWDLIHTAIRPVGGALVAVATLGDASTPVEGLVALLGGAVAAGSHLTKTSTRAVANTSPEPVSNWILSFGEDLFVVGLAYLALQHPIAALVVAAILIALILAFAAVITRTVRRWFARRLAPARHVVESAWSSPPLYGFPHVRTLEPPTKSGVSTARHAGSAPPRKRLR